MTPDYWKRQAAGEPLYPDLLWSKPENRLMAGKLLIIGGNAHGFAAPAEAYAVAHQTGAGSVRVLLPDTLHKIAGALLETVEFAPSTPSGSFSQKALANFLEMSSWADAVLIAGDLGRNSETAIVIEKFLSKFTGAVTLSRDAADYAVTIGPQVCLRPNTTLILTIAQLQKLFIEMRWPVAITFSMDLTRLVTAIHDFTIAHPCQIVVKHEATYIVAFGGNVVTSPAHSDPEEMWRTRVGAKASVWYMQNPKKPLEALATALIDNQN